MDKFLDWVKNNWFEAITSILMILGLIFSFFYNYIGGALVGLAFGLTFAEELQSFFSKTKEYYAARGIFKTLILAGTALFLLIVQTTFLIASLIGFAIMTLFNWKKTTPPPQG